MKLLTHPLSNAYGINDSGQVVGESQDSLAQARAFLYSQGTMTDVSPPNATQAVATAINATGQVVGLGQYPNQPRAFLYSAGVLTDLGLGGYSSAALALNNHGEVVGYAATATGQAHAFLYADGVMTDLGTLGGIYSVARGINASGQVVGYAIDASAEFHAFLYTDGTTIDLNSFLPQGSGWLLRGARAINDSGSIVGIGTLSGQLRGFLMVLDCNANGTGDATDIANGTSQDCNANGVPDECDVLSSSSPDANHNSVPDECDPPFVTAANPPLDNPVLPGQQPFGNVLQTGPTPALLRGIGSCLTPGEGAVGYCTISVTFNVSTVIHVGDIAIACSYTGTPPGSAPCPNVSEVTGSGVGPYSITLDGPIPPGGRAALTFANAAPGQVLRYEYLPGDENMSGTTTGQDVLSLVTAINMGMANMPSNLPR